MKEIVNLIIYNILFLNCKIGVYKEEESQTPFGLPVVISRR